MSKQLHLSRISLSYTAISEGKYDSHLLTNYEIETVNFCQQWLSGQIYFNVHTSGSTGRPKPIRIHREQMQASAQATAQALGLEAGDAALVCINTAYIGGKMMLVRGMELDLELHLIPPQANPYSAFLENFGAKQIQFLAFVPLQLQAILAQNPEAQAWLDGTKAIILGGAPVSFALEQKIQSLRAPIYSTYGMTETVSHIALRRLNGAKASAFYEALPSVEVRLDQRACLQIKAPMTQNQWLTTNDRVELLADQRFRWLGRVDNIINSGGVKIQLEKIEQAIEALFYRENLSQAFFLAGLPDEKWGEKLSLFIEGEAWEKSREEAFLEKLAESLDSYEKPRAVYYLPKFVRTDTQKIHRKASIRLAKN